jgi:NAD(P)-dependent dehydrogenase (short-subunit alcohol dehydrogenase family)
MRELNGKVAVVTGGASGVGKGLVHALLDEGARVVIADVEKAALDTAVDELRGRGEVIGVPTDVSKFESVDALAQQVFDTFGACHLLFNNAGVTSGGGGKPWEQEPNDWYWCFGVNVFGVVHGVLAFVPRMLASGEPGVIVNTSSGDGGFAPVPYASVYASSKAAVSCFTEALAAQLQTESTQLRAAVFYPSGGLLETGLWTADRNRPAELARERQRAAAPKTTLADYKRAMEEAGKPVTVMDVDELGRFAIQGVKDGKFIISYNLDEIEGLLKDRAVKIGQGAQPPNMSDLHV